MANKQRTDNNRDGNKITDTEGLPIFYLPCLPRAYLYLICHVYLGLTYILFATSTEGVPIFYLPRLPRAYLYFICHV